LEFSLKYKVDLYLLYENNNASIVYSRFRRKRQRTLILENTEEPIKNEQSRDTGHTKHRTKTNTKTQQTPEYKQI
jgi:hypothetical protein